MKFRSSGKIELRLLSKKGFLKWSIVGLVLFLFGVMMLLLDPVGRIVSWKITMSEGSFAESLWEEIPVEVFNKVYIFNITNKERFLSGEDDKLTFEEIGPYVYREVRRNENITFNDNGTMSYTPNISVIFMPERSVGDIFTDQVVTINVPLLGIVAMNAQASTFKQLGLNFIISSTKSEAILTSSVHDFMWGYEDPLISLTSSYLPHWIDFKKFGLMDRLYTFRKDVVTVNLNESAGLPYSIESWNGSPGLKHWNYIDKNTSLPCNTLAGAFEGLIYPSNMAPGPMKVYKKIFCRTLQLELLETSVEPNGLEAHTYGIADSELTCSNPDNVCYCPKDGPCLPDGLMDVTPCYYGLPLAISFPHFFGGDPALPEKFVGIKPEKEKHSSSCALQPNIGMPLRGSIKIQVNLVLGSTKFNKKTRPFSNMAIPVMWIDSCVENLPNYLMILILLGFKYLPLAQVILGWFMCIFGPILFFYNAVVYVKSRQEPPKESTNSSPLYLYPARLSITETPTERKHRESLGEEMKSLM